MMFYLAINSGLPVFVTACPDKNVLKNAPRTLLETAENLPNPAEGQLRNYTTSTLVTGENIRFNKYGDKLNFRKRGMAWKP
ncbi:MAG: hypothetical protein HYX42_09890 [Polaromonas sp.]|uniref:hypothetical protein n=1 Tax=Polaromonas sp. TaxID=1869339 RepID=UPI0025E1BA1E|nr:hypothetical protein [Polaromonas sp.]MBI2726545.1 hypothetical protein [Polaromonas sp.]